MQCKELAFRIDNDVVNLVKKLTESGYETYIVGGAVRDLLLGIKPKDYDVATSATPEEIKSLFKKECRIIGRRFKLVHYYVNRKIIEISTFRKEPPLEERFVQVKGKMKYNENSYGAAYEDAWRRDFTVNAIFLDPVSGEIIDYTGMGIKDLHDGIVRAIGNAEERFVEDPVRILRALKLAGQYSFNIEPETNEAINKSKSLIRGVSISRLTFELEKIIKSCYSAKIMRKFFETGFLDILLPKLSQELRSNEKLKEIFFEMLKEWNLRISQGVVRVSFSMSLAIFLLPFCMKIILDKGWHKASKHPFEIEPMLIEVTKDILYPYHFPRKVMSVSRRIILMQVPLLKYRQREREKVIQHHRFKDAMEVFETLNKVIDKKKEFFSKGS